ncbi:MAG: amino acid permease [Opitutus sp.]|nr:amino acid permease [Opitutus sp.]
MSNDSTKPNLVRAIGRWTLVALVVNSIIGSGIFGLPGDIAKFLGPAAPWAYLIAALGIGIIMAVHAELASQFSDAGGPYLYAREAFGRFCGIQMGWFGWLVRVTSAAANANLFVIYFGEFWRGATSPLPRAILLALLIGALAAANFRGVRAGARISNLLTTAKLIPLGALIVAGLIFVHRPASIAAAADPSLASWSNAIMALIFAFGGFEMALIPMAEAKNPRRDAPFALFTGLAVVTAVYALIQVIAMWSVPDLAGRTRPLADAARVIIGPAGAGLIAIGAMLSTYGHLSAQLVATPRLTYAMAKNGDLPRALAAVHPRFRTPHLSIVLWAVIVLGLAIYGSFIWNAILSAAGRLLTYSIGCAALIRLRRLRPTADAFRLPAGPLFAVLGMVFCVAMIFRMNAARAQIILTLTGLAAVNWLVVRRRAQRETRPGV